MIRVTRDQVTETSPHVFACEASDLYIDQWPQVIDTDIGNGRPFFLVSSVRSGEDLVEVTYRQEHGCCDLVVFND